MFGGKAQLITTHCQQELHSPLGNQSRHGDVFCQGNGCRCEATTFSCVCAGSFCTSKHRKLNCRRGPVSLFCLKKIMYQHFSEEQSLGNRTVALARNYTAKFWSPLLLMSSSGSADQSGCLSGCHLLSDMERNVNSTKLWILPIITKWVK